MYRVGSGENRRQGLTDSDLLRIIFPNRELRDFMDDVNECDDVVPNSEEVVVIVLLELWARIKK